MTATPNNDVSRIFREEGHRIDAAIRRAVAAALRRHKLLGESIVIERDGRIITIPPEQIRDDGTVAEDEASAEA